MCQLYRADGNERFYPVLLRVAQSQAKSCQVEEGERGRRPSQKGRGVNTRRVQKPPLVIQSVKNPKKFRFISVKIRDVEH